MGKKTNIGLMGFTISITYLMAIALAFLIKSLGVIWGDWFANNAVAIAIVSGIVVLAGIITGMVSLKSMVSNSKGIF